MAKANACKWAAPPSPVATQVEVTPCDVTHTKRWGWWCYAHNKPAYKSHDGLYYCNPDSPSPVATQFG